MNFLKYFIIAILSYFLSLVALQIQKEAAIVVFVRDNENNKISQVDLTLEGYSVPPLQAKYSEKAGAYYFDSIPKGYNIIIASKKNYEDAAFISRDGFPKKIHLQLLPYGNLIKTDSIWSTLAYSPYAGYTTRKDTLSYVNTSVSVRDDYKILIELKSTSNLSYNIIKSSIDSFVEPLGLEYINDIVPETYFLNIFNFDNIPVQNSVIYNIDKTSSLRELMSENQLLIKQNGMMDDDYLKRSNPNWEKNCYLFPYRKKDHSKFRLYNDAIIELIKKNYGQIQLHRLIYKKLYISTAFIDKDDIKLNYTGEINYALFKKYDRKIMNYHFLKRYDNDSTRVLLMDYNFTGNFPSIYKKGLYNIERDNGKHAYKHKFLLNRHTEIKKEGFYNSPGPLELSTTYIYEIVK